MPRTPEYPASKPPEEGTLFSGYPELVDAEPEVVGESSVTAPAAGEGYQVVSRDEAMAMYEEQMRQRGELVGRHDHSNWPQSRIMEAARRQFPTAEETGEEIVRAEQARLSAARRQAKAKSKPRGGRSPAQNPGIRRLPGYDKVIPPEAR